MTVKSQPTKDKVQFLSSHKPILESGTYKLSAVQTLTLPGGANPSFSAALPTPGDAVNQEFFVAGERFRLAPSHIGPMFPPDKSRGRYLDAFPHVVLTRSTLPWERDAGAAGAPWLALLSFSESEAPSANANPPTLSVQTLGALQEGATQAAAYFSKTLVSEPGQSSMDLLTVIDVDKAFLMNCFPDLESLKMLCHARNSIPYRASLPPAPLADLIQGVQWPALEAWVAVAAVDAARWAAALASSVEPGFVFSGQLKLWQKAQGISWVFRDVDREKTLEIQATTSGYDVFEVREEVAVVVGNRVPKPGAKNVIHLVSLEKRVSVDANGSLAFGNVSSDGKVRLVSLASWSFYCEDPKYSFEGLLENLNASPGTLMLEPLPGASAAALSRANSGGVPLPHLLRQGSRTVSWYHGPLSPAVPRTPPEISLPVKSADELLLYSASEGMVDASYAAAWEHGRSACLANSRLSSAMFHWKQALVRGQLAAAQSSLHRHLPLLFSPVPETLEPPKVLVDWLSDLFLLKNAPFQFLVPDSSMLPPESIRFFHVDSFWLSCAAHGAAAVGSVSCPDQAVRTALDNAISALIAKVAAPGAGFLLRSEAVKGFPNLGVYGYADAPAGLNLPVQDSAYLLPLRLQRLAANVMICLFQETALAAVDIHQQHQTMHFGVDVEIGKTTGEPETFSKMVRNPETGEELGSTSPQPLRNRVAPVKGTSADPGLEGMIMEKLRPLLDGNAALKAKYQPFNAAEFAELMIESPSCVRFTRG